MQIYACWEILASVMWFMFDGFYLDYFDFFFDQITNSLHAPVTWEAINQNHCNTDLMYLPPHLASIDFCDYGFKMVIEVSTVVPVKSTITLGINPFTVQHAERHWNSMCWEWHQAIREQQRWEWMRNTNQNDLVMLVIKYDQSFCLQPVINLPSIGFIPVFGLQW